MLWVMTAFLAPNRDDYDVLVSDERVRELLRKNAVIPTLTGPRNQWFTVVNNYYHKYEVKIDHETGMAVCSCEAQIWGGDCYHVKACRAFLIRKEDVEGAFEEVLVKKKIRGLA